MKSLLSIIVLLFFATISFADPVSSHLVGFHWYVDPTPDIQNASPKKDLKKSTEITYQNKLSELRTQFREALSTAILQPTDENIRQYLVLSNLMSSQAGQFSILVQKTLLAHPELSYSIDHPSESQALNLTLDAQKAKQIEAMQRLATHTGLMYVYRGHEPIDAAMAKTVMRVAKQYHFPLLGLSVDEVQLDGFDKSIADSQKAQALGIHYFPALLLIDMQTKQVQPVSYGFLSEDELIKQFYYVENDFTPEW